MSSAVHFEDVVVEMLDAQAETGDAERADRLELGLGQRAGLALEGYFFGFVPRQQPLHCLHQPGELPRRNVRRSSAAEVNELGLAPADERPLGVKRQLPDRG